ncbi:unnamed protein product [Nezara viridula]|uniref:MADF domain-containing protein n=1 Tax=Nezara viridula TaxID=85310 RepID=A0A9P0HIV9_NEZVI|nr:unnamed protein product [Nezara viridula]
MDVVKLIRAVRSKKPLWDRKHAYYHDRIVTMGLWNDVAISLGSDRDKASGRYFSSGGTDHSSSRQATCWFKQNSNSLSRLKVQLLSGGSIEKFLTKLQTAHVNPLF